MSMEWFLFVAMFASAVPVVISNRREDQLPGVLLWSIATIALAWIHQ